MTETSGRDRAEAAREAAERAAAVAAMLREAEEKGWVPIERDAVDYIPPDDKQFTEVVEGGHEWARYTARVKGGGVYLEGGIRRVLWTTQKNAQKLLAAKAAELPKETRLFGLIEAWRRARGTRGEGLGVHAFLWSDEKLRKALEDRIRARAGADDEAGAIRSSAHVEILEALGVDGATIRRLRGDRTVRPDEAKAAAAAAAGETDEDPAALLAAAVAAAKGRKDAVVLENRDAPFVGREDPGAERVIGDAGDDFAYAVLLGSGDVHLEGGLRRVRYTVRKTAEKWVAERVEALLGGRDLRVLLWLRKAVATAAGEFSAEARIAGDAKLRARLDAAIRDVVGDFAAAPLLRAGQAAELRAAGVDEVVVSRLVHPDARAASWTPSDRSATGAGAGAATSFVAALEAARARKDSVVLRDADAPYVGRDDPSAIEVLEAPSADWAYAVVLKGGDVHAEGGLQRERYTTAKAAEAIVAARIEALLGSADLRALLWLRGTLPRARGVWSAVARIAGDPGLRARLDEAIRTAAVGCVAMPALGFDQATQMRDAGVDDGAMERLALPAARAALSAASLRARAVAYTAWRPRKVTTVREAVDGRVPKGYVWVAEDVASYLDAEDERIRERLGGRPDWCTHAVVLDDDSVHLEGGAVRRRFVPEPAVAGMLEAAAERMMERGSFYDLLDVASVLDVGPGAASVAAVFAGDPERRKAIEARILEMANDVRHERHVVKRLHRDALLALGVPDELVARLRG